MAIETLRPNAVGTTTAWPNEVPPQPPPPPPKPHWQLVDDVIPDENVTYIFSSAADNLVYTDLYNIPNTAIPATAIIDQIEVFCRVRGGIDPLARSPRFWVAIRIGGFTFTGAGMFIVNPAYHYQSNVWLINPATLAPWTIAGINALEIGCLGQSTAAPWFWPVSCTQEYVVVTYHELVASGLNPVQTAKVLLE